jgi:hypothetical protein
MHCDTATVVREVCVTKDIPLVRCVRNHYFFFFLQINHSPLTVHSPLTTHHNILYSLYNITEYIVFAAGSLCGVKNHYCALDLHCIALHCIALDWIGLDWIALIGNSCAIIKIGCLC